MHKVEPGILVNTMPNWVVYGLPHPVPAHVRYFQRFPIFTLQIVAEKTHLPRQNTQAVNAIIFFTALQQGLHANADSKHRLCPDSFGHQRIKTAVADFAHTIANCPHAREHNTVRIVDVISICGNHNPGFRRHALQRLGGGMQVAHAVIQHSYGLRFVTH